MGPMSNGAPARRLAAWYLVVLILVPATRPVLAQDDTGRFEVKSAYAELLDGVYYLNANIEYHLSKSAQDILQSGVPLTLELEIEVERNRKFFLDQTVAALRQRYEIRFHALSERYIVVNLNSGEQQSFSTLSTALFTLGRVTGLPVLDETLLQPELKYEIRIRAALDVHEIPRALRLVAFLFGDSKIVSEWFTWPLQG